MGKKTFKFLLPALETLGDLFEAIDLDEN